MNIEWMYQIPLQKREMYKFSQYWKERIQSTMSLLITKTEQKQNKQQQKRARNKTKQQQKSRTITTKQQQKSRTINTLPNT